MELSNLIGIAAGTALVIAIALVIWRASAGRQRLPSEMPDSLRQVSQARIDPDELPASLISEQIEEMVRAELAKHVDIAPASLDFATAADGSLEVWYDGQRYADPQQIDDERVRSAIVRAVEAFNR